MTTLWFPTALPWIPPAHDEQIVSAVRAVQSGIANSAQQQLFWRYLMHVTAASEEFADMSFRPDSVGGHDATIFAEGKRFVGLMIRKLLRPEFTKKPDPRPAETSVARKLRARRMSAPVA